MTTGTQGALDAMVASVMARKEGAASTLTPVGAEKPDAWRGPQHPVAPFPDDFPVEQFRVSIARARSDLAHIADSLTAMEQTIEAISPIGGPIDPVGAVAKETLERLSEADDAENSTFAEDFARKQAAAQAATFGWSCPTHKAFTQKTSRKGRTYRACPHCDDFERLP